MKYLIVLLSSLFFFTVPSLVAQTSNETGSVKGFDVLLGSFLPATPGADTAIIYENTSGGGKSKYYSVGDEIAQLSAVKVGTSWNWNDKVSSVAVGKGACLKLYENSNYGGGSIVFFPESSTGTITINSLSGVYWNDKASSLKVVDRDDCLITINDNDVKVYKDAYYRGDVKTYSWDTELGSMPSGWNDKISSIVIGKNACITIWKNSNYNSLLSKLDGNSSEVRYFSNLGWHSWNDVISSLRVRKRGSCAEQ